MNFIRRYWIAGLVLCLVVIHAVIIGYVRSEAARIKVTASNEIPVGTYYVQSADRNWMRQLRVHLLVHPEKRLAAKATIEHNRWLIHEAVEEKIAQLDPALVTDPVLLEIKAQIKSAIEETLQEELIERVLVNDRVDLPISNFHYTPAYDMSAPEPIYTSKPILQPLKPEDEVEK